MTIRPANYHTYCPISPKLQEIRNVIYTASPGPEPCFTAPYYIAYAVIVLRFIVHIRTLPVCLLSTARERKALCPFQTALQSVADHDQPLARCPQNVFLLESDSPLFHELQILHVFDIHLTFPRQKTKLLGLQSLFVNNTKRPHHHRLYRLAERLSFCSLSSQAISSDRQEKAPRYQTGCAAFACLVSRVPGRLVLGC